MRNIKYFLLTALLAVLILPSFASAMTAEELIAKIKDLQQQIEQLKAELAQIQGQAPAWCYDFRENLTIGAKGEGAAALHMVLGKEGFDVFNEEKTGKEFGESTASAVSGLQQKYQNEILTPLGLKYGTGFLGKATRAKLNTLYGCNVKAVPIPFCSPVAVSCQAGSKIICPLGLDEKSCPFPCKCVPVACTQEAKVCPDGSTVSRIPLSCEFAACPAEKINQAPVIYGVSGPTSLQVNENGTWVVKANDPEEKPLIFAASWGDGLESQFRPLNYLQSASVSHSYSKTGIYNITFTVTDYQGLSVKAGITVKVGEITSPNIVYEQVKCLFRGSQTEQKCNVSSENYSGYGCTGIETCVVDVKGIKGDKVTWKSSCGGYAYTTIDGQNEYAEFNCSIISPSITVLSPNGGEEWPIASTQTIRWTSSNVSRIVLDLVNSSGGLVYKNLVNMTGNPGSATLTIPSYVEPGQYWMRVGTCSDSVVFCTTTGSYDPVTIFDTSDAPFSIVAATPAPATASITVISPNGGELWEIGKTYTIQWESKDLPSGNNLTIELLGSKGTNALFSSIANNANSQSWTIPKDFAVGTYILKVISYAFSCGGSNSSCGDDSERPFSVVATTVAKTCTELATSQNYYFNGCSDSGYDNICLNKFTGIYQGCTKNTRNDCTESNANAEQNILCPITPTQKTITVLYPNGGESWEIGKTYEIKWTTTGYSPDGVVRIIITDESSGTENPIFNAYNKGGFSWTVPSTYQAHSNYKIKIVAPDEKYDKSDAPFSIISPQPTEPTACTDSDKGNDIYLKGCTTYLISGGAKETVCDFCRESYIQEYFCQDNKMAYSIQNCPNGCQDGVCLAASTTGSKDIENFLASISQIISQLNEQIKKLIGR